MNVLLTSAGRRTSLVRAFQTAARERGGNVLAGDMDALAPALQVADQGVVLPPIDDSDYIPTLIEQVRAEEIDLVVPLIDPELSVLAETQAQFLAEECRVIVSDPPLLELALDKWALLEHFDKKGVRTPSTWLCDRSSSSEWPDSVFLKPRRGSGSKRARKLSRADADRAASSMNSAIVQEVVEAPEMTVDTLFDLDGDLLHYVPRLRIRTAAGESIQGRTLRDEKWGQWIRNVLRKLGRLGAKGPVTLQAFCTEPEPTLSEVNPRFAGGFPLAYAAGADYPEWLLQMSDGASPEPALGDYREDLCMTRAFTEWFFEADTLR